MQNCPQHRFLILTKRPQNIAEMLPADWGQGYTNVWLGVSAETDARGRERIPVLLDIAVHAGQRFVSYEPALGPLDFSSLCRRGDLSQSVRWVIAGGENGPGARPAHVQWFRRLRDACKLHGVPFFFKGWGAYVHAGQLPYLLPGVVKRPKGAGAMTWPDGSVSFRWKRPLVTEYLDGVKHEGLPDE
jgi:protein gp37